MIQQQHEDGNGACDEKQGYPSQKTCKPAKVKVLTKQTKSLGKSFPEVQTGSSEYQKILAKRDLTQIIPYSMTTSFKENDIVNHQSFGVGFVKRIIPLNKIEVLFSQGSKVLICKNCEFEQKSKSTPQTHEKKARSSHTKGPKDWIPWSRTLKEKDDTVNEWGFCDSED